MVDASLRMSIVNLLRDLRDNFGVTVIYITHDLATAYYISNRIVKMGPAQAILEAPEHPYAQLLKNSVLSNDEAGHGKVQSPDRSLAQAAAKQSGSGMLEGSGAEGTRYEVSRTDTLPAAGGATPCRARGLTIMWTASYVRQGSVGCYQNAGRPEALPMR